MWFRLMLVAMTANGFALLGAKVLAEAGLGVRYSSHYLAAWYGCGFLLALAMSARRVSRPYLRETIIGAGMALMSFLGQACLVGAVSNGAPGYVVYPVIAGATIFLVALAGRLIFRERVGPYGIAGIACGIAAVVILSLP
jgi:multidrug transporter EmrE-like cation transporter